MPFQGAGSAPSNPQRERYVKIGNHLAQHGELSLTAIGLSTHIQSLPTGAKVSIKALSERFSEGETRIAGALRELEAHGYLSRTRERLPSGQVVTRTVSYNVPLVARTSPRPSGRSPKSTGRPPSCSPGCGCAIRG
ncbi:helix-turn-helix domain-containing protein [Streptomyces sp. ISL-43]|uniref:helix-turn-helix domain-containing protein n=1 Tax=Streptomyces sp. ISL-43 TaxID=2819183 RepID=UPI0020356ED4|nr:helix-turn-helix domain-containing protein [Streptomyces sp. ISL-43]